MEEGSDKFTNMGWKKAMSTGTRGNYRMVERRWVLEYITSKCANAIYKTAHKRLGSLPTDVAKFGAGIPLQSLRSYQPYADAVCVWPDRIEIIEFKVHDPMKAIAQLLYYKSLAVQDDVLKQFLPRSIVIKLVYWRYDASLDALCKANGIVFEVEKPSWLDPILRDYGYKV
jgi:hypothetical protein